MIAGITIFTLAMQIGNALPSTPSSTPSESVSGTVLRAGTLAPIAEVSVVLTLTTPDAEFDYRNPPASFSAESDSLGRFTVKDVKPGVYRMTFSANGYVRQEYKQRTFPGQGSTIDVTSGAPIRDLVVTMTPTGTVTGTVRDADAHPLARVPVQLLRTAYDREGRRNLATVASAWTNDRGEYRLFLLTPGRYYLKAGELRSESDPPNANVVPGHYTTVVFPGVPDFQKATPVDVPPGGELRGMDFTLSMRREFRLRGKVVDEQTGLPPTTEPTLQLSYRDPASGDDAFSRERPSYRNGVFEFQDVLPGLYALTAYVLENFTFDRPMDRTLRNGYSLVQIEGDTNDIVVTVRTGDSIAGALRVEGASLPVESLFAPNGRHAIRLRPSGNGAKPGGIPDVATGEVNDDGSFRIGNVMIGGEYRLNTDFFSERFYVKRAQFGAIDLLTGPLQYTGKETGNLEIVLSPNVASLEGTVTDVSLSLAAGAQVVLVPDSSFRKDLLRTAVTDQNGHFVLPNVAPGDYRVYAWEAIEPNGWFDPENLKRGARDARPVHLQESSRQTVVLQAIPAVP